MAVAKAARRGRRSRALSPISDFYCATGWNLSTRRPRFSRGVVIRTVINGFTFDGATKDAMQHKPKPPRPLSGPVSSTRRLTETEPTLATSRAIRKPARPSARNTGTGRRGYREDRSRGKADAADGGMEPVAQRCFRPSCVTAAVILNSRTNSSGK